MISTVTVVKRHADATHGSAEDGTVAVLFPPYTEGTACKRCQCAVPPISTGARPCPRHPGGCSISRSKTQVVWTGASWLLEGTPPTLLVAVSEATVICSQTLCNYICIFNFYVGIIIMDLTVMSVRTGEQLSVTVP